VGAVGAVQGIRIFQQRRVLWANFPIADIEFLLAQGQVHFSVIDVVKFHNYLRGNSG